MLYTVNDCSYDEWLIWFFIKNVCRITIDDNSYIDLIGNIMY